MHKIQPKTLFTGKNAVYLSTCHSTNDFAAEIIQKKDISEGTFVITDNQTSGKGQRGNTWESAPGKNLTFSMILKPAFLPIQDQFKLNIAVSLGLYQTFRSYLDEDLKIKWPNDLFYFDYKLAGILIESLITSSKINHSIVGLGLNINQGSFELNRASSLSILNNGMQYDLSKILTEFAENFEEEYLLLKNGNDVLQKERFERLLFRKDEWHKYRKEGETFDGKILGINSDGLLRMETKFGLKQFQTKEFEYIY